MSVIDILFNGNIIIATFVFVLLSIATEIFGVKVLDLFQDIAVSEFIFEKFLIPLARAVGMMMFVILCYPVLFGLTEAPPLDQLLSTGSLRTSTLMNLLFIVPLLFSLIPVFGSLPALILPVQGIAGASLVFSWMQAAMQVDETQYLPHGITILIIILLAILTHTVARQLSFHVSETINRQFEIDDGQKIAYRVIIVVAQIPVILIYTRGLGSQL